MEFADGRNGEARIGAFSEETNRKRFSAAAPEGPAIAVSGTLNDGGWSAEDENGNRLETGFANGPFLAIALLRGNHRIALTYLPPGSGPGAAISLATLTVLLIIGLTARRRSGGP